MPLPTPMPVEIWEANGRYRVDRETGCWLWQRQFSRLGYPVVYRGKSGRNALARRAVFRHYRVLPDGASLLSTCRNRACVNPAHMRVRFARVDYGLPCDACMWKEDSGGCWVWRGSVTRDGWPLAKRKRRRGAGWVYFSALASRAVWTDHVGPIPRGRILRRTCGNKLCVRPGHFKLSSFREL